VILFLAYGRRSIPQGLVDMAGFLRQREHDARVVNLRGNLDALRRVKVVPEIVGISVYTAISGQLRKLIAMVRKKWPHVCVVVGGPHINEDVLAVETDLADLADWLVIGPGEYAMRQIIGGGQHGIVRGEMLTPDDFRDAPWPTESDARMLTSSEAWKNAVIFNRGCPFRCAFCAPSRPILYRDAGEAVAYLGMLDQLLGRDHWFIKDDVFAVNKAWLEAFARERSQQSNRTPLRCFVHGRMLNRERFDLLRETGVTKLSLGCESADDKVLEMAGKGTTLGDYERIDKMVRGSGIDLHCLWMLGLPGETPRTLELTLRAMKDLGTVRPNCGFATPYPGTQFYRNADHYGRIINDDWSTWTPKEISFLPRSVSFEDLRGAMRTAQRICRG
jgi:radical SAM superfamily enzyme YgiQ (UPF0313 family)